MADPTPSGAAETRQPGAYVPLGQGGTPSPKRRAIGDHRAFAFSIAAIVFAFDQLTKFVVTNTLQLQRRGSMELLSFFDLTWVENRGVSMGFLTASSNWARWLLVLFTAAIAGGVVYWIWNEKRRDDAAALALVLGGALGNILDRMRFGYVVDFADLHFGTWRPFLIFNVADAAITIGVLLLLVRALLTRDKKPSRKEV
ncbi:MAG TPA: signal peptidase II [Allosphingosinicella sp.]|jgi:signal peptidase II